MTVPTKLDQHMTDEVLNVIRNRLNLDQASDISLVSIEVDADAHKIVFELVINTSERPEVLAKRYFGLTGKVREALGSDWHGFFPVITPQINSAAHA